MRQLDIIYIHLISRVLSHQLADLIQLNRLTRNSSIFQSLDVYPSRRGDYSIAMVKFQFANDLIDFLNLLNSTRIEIRLLNFTTVGSPLFFTNLPLLIHSNQSSRTCVSEQLANLYLTKHCHEGLVLGSLAIRFEHSGYFSVCAQLGLDPFDPPLIESHQCVNFHVDDNIYFAGAHQFRYKPLFIVLMYLLCAFILAAISAAKCILHRHKLTVKKKINERSGVKSQSDTSLFQDSHDKTVTEPLLHRDQSKVLFQVNSAESLKVPEQPTTEADHILNDKPWARTRTDNEGFREEIFYNSNQEAIKPVSNLTSSPSMVVYESNV